MRPSFTPLALLPAVALLALVGFAAGSAGPPGSTAAGARSGAAPPRLLPTDTVKVFVVWGSSNACGPGDAVGLSPDPNSGPGPNRAKEWYWEGTEDVLPLDDAVPCHNRTGAGTDKGSAWPQFAITYQGATGHLFFLSSAARGSTLVSPVEPRVTPNPDLDWHPDSDDDELYAAGLAAISGAMTAAAIEFPASEGYTVEFGGVLWNQGNDFRQPGQLPPWTSYRGYLHDLLTAFGEDVVAGAAVGPYPDARFYYINALLPYASVLAESRQALDAEADVCAAYAFCSAVEAAEEIKAGYDACDPGDGDLTCEQRYYNVPDDGHWAQLALNAVGARAAGVALAHEALLVSEEDPFTWEVGVEVPQPSDDGDTQDATPPVRLAVYDDAGTEVTDSPFYIAPSIANPDWRADFGGSNPDPVLDWQADWATLSTAFLTFEFWRDDPTVTIPR